MDDSDGELFGAVGSMDGGSDQLDDSVESMASAVGETNASRGCPNRGSGVSDGPGGVLLATRGSLLVEIRTGKADVTLPQ
jgi:hypothetical protein